MSGDRLTLDETLRPLPVTCGFCGGPMETYPQADGTPIGVCRCTSPGWLLPFCRYGLDSRRAELGLDRLYTWADYSRAEWDQASIVAVSTVQGGD